MIIRIAVIVDHRDQSELLVRSQLQTQGIVLDAACETTGPVGVEFQSSGRRIQETRRRCRAQSALRLQLGQECRRHTRHASGTARACGRAALDAVLLHDQERRDDRIGIDLVRIVRHKQPLTTTPDIGCLHHHLPGQFALNAEVPFVHCRQVHMRIEHGDWRRVGPELLRRREQRRRLHGGRRHLCREPARNRIVDGRRQHAARRDRIERGRACRRIERRGAALDETGNASGRRRHLERRDGIEGDSIADANHALARFAKDVLEKT